MDVMVAVSECRNVDMGSVDFLPVNDVMGATSSPCRDGAWLISL